MYITMAALLGETIQFPQLSTVISLTQVTKMKSHYISGITGTKMCVVSLHLARKINAIIY